MEPFQEVIDPPQPAEGDATLQSNLNVILNLKVLFKLRLHTPTDTDSIPIFP